MFGQIYNKLGKGGSTERFTEKVFDQLQYRAVRELEGYALIYRPCAKAMAKYPPSQVPDGRRPVVITAPRAMADFPYVLGDRLSASLPRKHEVNDCMLGYQTSSFHDAAAVPVGFRGMPLSFGHVTVRLTRTTLSTFAGIIRRNPW